MLPRLLVAIPCLNEESTIEKVIHSIPKKIPGIAHTDVLVVDDGSEDRSLEIAKRCNVKILSHQSNKGVGAAFQSAKQYALSNDYDFMVSIDGDDQFCSTEIPSLLLPLLEGTADFVTGARFCNAKQNRNIPLFNRIGNQFIKHLLNLLLGTKLNDVCTGFRAFSKNALTTMELRSHFTYTQESIISLRSQGIRVVEVPVTVKYFPDRISRVAPYPIIYMMRSLFIIVRAYFGTFGNRPPLFSQSPKHA